MNRKALIPTSALIVFGTMVLADAHEKKTKGKVEPGKLPTTHEWLGFIITYTMLSAGADLGLDFAGGLAVLVMVTMLLVRGPEAYAYLTGKLQKSSFKPIEGNVGSKRPGRRKK